VSFDRGAGWVAAIADVHLGNHRTLARPSSAGVNDRALEVARLLGESLRVASDANAAALIVCGDLMDVDDPTPQLLTLAADVLAESPIPVLLLVGNHDQRSALRGDHALGPLGAVNRVRVVDTPCVVPLATPRGPVDVLMVPFQHGPAADYIPARLRELAAQCRPDAARIAAVHAGIEDATTPHFLRGSSEAIPANTLLAAMTAADVRVQWTFAGNWHNRALWRVRDEGFPGAYAGVQQVGALAPTGFDNPGGAGRYGGVAFVAPHAGVAGALELPGPRFFRVSTDAELSAALTDRSALRRYIHRVAPPDAVKAVRAQMDELTETGTVCGVLVDVHDPTEEDRRATVTQTVQSATTLEMALAAYVAAMPDTALEAPLDAAPVTPSEVLATARRFLGLSSSALLADLTVPAQP